MQRNFDVAKTLTRDFIPLKLNLKDGWSTYQLHASLRVKTYPTIIIASPDGNILQTILGYVDSKGLQMQLATAKRVAMILEVQENARRGAPDASRWLTPTMKELLEKMRRQEAAPDGPIYYDLPPSERNKVQGDVVFTERKG